MLLQLYSYLYYFLEFHQRRTHNVQLLDYWFAYCNVTTGAR